MSRINIQNTNLDFNVTLVALDEATGDGTSLSIDIGAISNFEIDENLIDFGITGSITYINWFQIVDKLNVTTGKDRSSLYIVVDIQDVENSDGVGGKISFVGLMENSGSSGGNIANSKQTYSFEEASTSRLKKISVASLGDLGDRTKRTTAERLIIRFLRITNTPHDINSFTRYLVRDEGKILYDKAAGKRTFEPRTLNPRDFHPDENNDSAYTIINNIYNVAGARRRIPLLKTELVKLKGKDGEECTEERQLTIRNMISDRHIEFINEYISGTTRVVEQDFSDVYQEEFLIGPEERETANTSPYNKVEDYNHIKPDIGLLRKNIWGSYRLAGWAELDPKNPVGPDGFRYNLIRFNDIVKEFEQTIIDKQISNIPVFKDQDENQRLFSQQAISSESNSSEIMVDSVFCKLWKSFIFRNEAIVLRVKGQVYRKPGVFITIRGSVNTQGYPQTDLWFVISNKHIFNNGLYENEITAVRFFGTVPLPAVIPRAVPVAEVAATPNPGSNQKPLLEITPTPGGETNDSQPVPPAEENPNDNLPADQPGEIPGFRSDTAGNDPFT